MDKIFKCNCGCGGVEVGRWTDDCEDYCYIEFLKRNRAGRRLKTRLKMVWWLLSRGYYYDDDIVLSIETARDLGEELIALAEGGVNEES
jgi:hypothetical protein